MNYLLIALISGFSLNINLGEAIGHPELNFTESTVWMKKQLKSRVDHLKTLTLKGSIEVLKEDLDLLKKGTWVPDNER